jgi:predicted neuraminidase
MGWKSKKRLTQNRKDAEQGPRILVFFCLALRLGVFARASSESIMFIFEKAPFASCHASTIIELETGRFLAAWFGGKDEGAPDVRIWSSRFDGKVWSAPAVLADETGFPCWNPVLFKSKGGTLFLFYKAGKNPMSWTGYVRRSSDQGATWSRVEQLPAGLLGPIKNKPIQRADGTILAPTSVESHRAWACWIEHSSDEGKTWKRFGPIQVPDHPYGVIQPTLFERKDGSILAQCRSRGLGVIVQSESKDNGETWAPATKTELPNPGSGIDGVRVASGDFYLVYNHSREKRTPLNVARSTDEGKTWKTVATLEEQPGEYSYPALIQGQDRKLHVTYTYNRRHIKYLALDPASFK